jgi:hypothetical protein
VKYFLSALRGALCGVALLTASVVLAQGAPPIVAPPSGKPFPSGGAQGDPMIPYYNNTLVCHSAKVACHIWFNKDGSYRQFIATLAADGGFSLSGIDGQFTVSERNGVVETCLNARGIGGPMGYRPIECYALRDHKVGDAWSTTSNGMAMQFNLQAGHQVNAIPQFLN